MFQIESAFADFDLDVWLFGRLDVWAGCDDGVVGGGVPATEVTVLFFA